MNEDKAADLPERCGKCGHFSPHTAFGGCGVEKFDGNRFGRCGCKARNDDGGPRRPSGNGARLMPDIKNRADFTAYAAPEAIHAALAKARQAAADAAREVRSLEDLLQRRTAEEHARASAETAAAAALKAALEDVQ